MSTTEIAPTKQEPKAEITKPEPQSARQARLAAFTPGNLTEAIALSKMIANSDMVPREYKGKAANVLVAMQYGSEIGLAPLQALQSVAVINGRPCLWGDGALAVVQASPNYESHKEWIEGDNDSRTAFCQLKRKGQDYHTSRFSVADAKKAGLWGKTGPWLQYPNRMLAMRARGFALRDRFADALKGISIAEEAMDMPVDLSPAKQQREAATLDIAASISDLAPSQEPNRGHSDTGLQRVPDKKQEDVICAECRKVNGHEQGCSELTKEKQDAKTSKPTIKAAFMILDVIEKKKRNGEPYLILEVVAPDNTQGKLYCWHRTMYEYLVKAKGSSIECEISAETKDGKTYHQLEHIQKIADTPFVDNKPAQQAEMPAQAEDDF